MVNPIGIRFIYHSNRHSLAASVGVGGSPSDKRARLDQAVDLLLHGLGAARPGRR